MISIIVPIYNVERYLSQCIESLINQTYTDIEIILVDDGSTDRCSDICDSFAKKDSRIIVIHQENSGVSTARNAGLEIAKGQYIGFVDPDDWISPDMYGSMLRNLQETESDLAICGYTYCYEDGRIDEKREYERKPPELLTQKDIMRRMSDIPPSVRHCVWNKLFRKSLLQGILFPEQLCSSEDVWFLTEYLLRTKNAIIIHEPFYFNRVRDGSATHGGLSVHSLAESFRALDFMYQSIISAYPDLKNNSQAFLLDVYLLKYNEANRKANTNNRLNKADSHDLKQMRKAIRAEGVRALSNKEIYWRTRLKYLLI